MQNKIKVLLLVIISVISIKSINAQELELIDGIVGVVGNKIILKSDVENRYLQYKAQGFQSNTNMRCELFEELLFQKLLLNQAEIDSVFEHFIFVII